MLPPPLPSDPLYLLKIPTRPTYAPARHATQLKIYRLNVRVSRALHRLAQIVEAVFKMACAERLTVRSDDSSLCARDRWVDSGPVAVAENVLGQRREINGWGRGEGGMLE